MEGKPTKEEILKYFRYDKQNGNLIWINHWDKTVRTKQLGKIAGGINAEGYIAISLNERRFKIHRLVWFLETGRWPVQIDHINGIRHDNRFVNLRDVSLRQNSQNRKHHRDGNLAGCRFDRGKWQALIRVENSRIYLGRFNTEQEAHSMYRAACIVIGRTHV